MIESERDQYRVFKVDNSHKLQQQVATPKKNNGRVNRPTPYDYSF